MANNQPVGGPPTDDENMEEDDAPNPEEEEGQQDGSQGGRRGNPGNMFGPKRDLEDGQNPGDNGGGGRRGNAGNMFGPTRDQEDGLNRRDHGRGGQRGNAGNMFGPTRDQEDGQGHNHRGGRRRAAGMFGPQRHGRERPAHNVGAVGVTSDIAKRQRDKERRYDRGSRGARGAHGAIFGPRDRGVSRQNYSGQGVAEGTLIGPPERQEKRTTSGMEEDVSQPISGAECSFDGPKTQSKPASTEDQKIEGGTTDVSGTSDAKAETDSSSPNPAQPTDEETAATKDSNSSDGHDEKGQQKAANQKVD